MALGVKLFGAFQGLKPGTAVIPAGEEIQRAKPDEQLSLLLKERSFADYERLIQGRDLFSVPKEADPGPLPVNSVQDAKKENRMKDLILLGIVLDEKPLAVVQDKSTGQVVFVSTGDDLAGSQVQAIRQGKVELDCQGKKIELNFQEERESL
jgi:type II secretory pathway component PulC